MLQQYEYAWLVVVVRLGARAHQEGSSALLTSFGLSMDGPDPTVRERTVFDHATVGRSLVELPG